MQEETIASSTLLLKVEPIVAGFLGAVMSMRAIAQASTLNRITSMLAASGSAGYLTPAIAEWFNLTSANMQNAIGFFVGLLILNLTAGVIELSSNFAKDPVGATHSLMSLLFRWKLGDYSKPKTTKEDH